MLICIREHKVSRPRGGLWPYQNGFGEGEGHPRVENPRQCEGTMLISWVSQLLQAIC